MENNNNSFEEQENISEFEDIVSDSAFVTGNGKKYRKKKRGIKRLFERIGFWWYSLKKWQKQTIITVTSVLLVFAMLIGAFFIVFNYNYNNITGDPDDLGFENVINKKIINIALFGIDSRDPKSFKGLSDSIMVMSLNTETKTVKIISIMRDSLVPIEQNGKTVYSKITTAYSRGGPELAIKTLNQNFGLDISEYATVNFYGMTDIIDAVGGIDVELSKGEINVMGYEDGHSVNFGINGMICEQCEYMEIDPEPYYISSAGKQHLNGVQAVAYARIRHAANIDGTNNDYGRTDRQRYVMEQLFNKAVKMKSSRYIKLAKALIPCSETSLSYKEIMGLATNILLKSPEFLQTRIPFTEYQMESKSVKGAGSCIYYDLNFAKKILHAFIYDNITPEDYIAQNGIEKHDWYGNRNATTQSVTSSTYNEEPRSHTTTSEDAYSSVYTSSEDTSSEDTSSEEGNEE